MENLPPCPKCNCEYVYENGQLLVCPECGHEWIPSNEQKEESVLIVKDAHGNQLQDGDSVTVIKDVKVKGASAPLKIGTKIKDIHIVEPVNGHNLDVRVKGFGSIMLKSEFVKKSN
ncbi:MAG TPA: zinc ribbon domain-containing protein YjdM [Chlamydiales bacterium]|nr:zinc ribbon domain-containing protein YjdM [Chlamydiales bacterium]